MPYTTLIDTDTLARHLGDDAFAIVDCRFRLDDPAWGASAHASSHIPGAVYADLGQDMAGTKTGANGRHPLPEPSAFASTLGRLGIDNGTQVVAYDQETGMFASRFWWMLRWLGHDMVAVLDGGFAKWVAEGRDAASERGSRRARTFHPTLRTEMVADAEEVLAVARRPDWCLVDGRAPDRFRGENETIDRKAGHIPGAANHFFRLNIDEDGTLHQPAVLRARFEQALGGTPPERVVCYCGSGVSACQNLLSMEHAGLRGAKLYPGSWSEWSSDPARPTEPRGQKEAPG